MCAGASVYVCVCVCVRACVRTRAYNSLKGQDFALKKSTTLIKSEFSFNCTFLPVLVVSCLVTSPFVSFKKKKKITLLAHSFSEMSSIFERDRLFSFTCDLFKLDLLHN